MKRFKLFTILTVCAVMLTSCGSMQSTSDKPQNLPEDINEYVASAPAVTSEMNNADYWISKCDDPDTVLMDYESIQKINADNEPTLSVSGGKEIALSEIGNVIQGEHIAALLDAYKAPDEPASLFYNGKPASADYWDNLIKNINAGAVKDTVNVSFGFTVKRTDVKAAPTEDFISDSAEDLHYDMNAVADCAPYEPVAVLHKSKDNEWYYISAYGYAGWVKNSDLALCDSREDWLSRQNPEDFLVVTDREIRMAYDPYDPESSGQLLPMGTILPLIKPEDAPADFNGRSSYNSYIIKVPGRSNNGKIKDLYTLIPVSEDVSIGYMPYTRANIIEQSFKRLGDRYGWAGTYYSNDCSGITKEIFSCFGFEFPRNGKAQIRMVSMQSLDVSEYTDEDKLEVFSELPAGSLMYFPGHLMIYLGMDNNSPYVISAVGSMATPDMAKGDIIPVNSVIISSLTETARKTGKTWLNCITNLLTCEIK